MKDIVLLCLNTEKSVSHEEMIFIRSDIAEELSRFRKDVFSEVEK